MDLHIPTDDVDTAPSIVDPQSHCVVSQRTLGGRGQRQAAGHRIEADPVGALVQQKLDLIAIAEGLEIPKRAFALRTQITS